MRKIYFTLFLLSFQLSACYGDVRSAHDRISFDVELDGIIDAELSSTELRLGSSEYSRGLSVYGSVSYGANLVTNDIVLDEHSYYYMVDSSMGNIHMTLPYAGNCKGRSYRIKKISKDGQVTIYGGGNLIDEYDELVFNASDRIVDAITLMSSGVQWYIDHKPSANVSLVEKYLPSYDELSVWYDASDVNSLVVNSGKVSQWKDKSGNDKHADQGDGLYQPIFDEKRLLFQGGQYLRSYKISPFQSWSSNKTLVMMLSTNGSASNTILHYGVDGSTFRDEQWLVSSGSNIKLVDGHNSGAPLINAISSVNVGNGICLVYTYENLGGHNRIIRINGSEEFVINGTRTSDSSPDGRLYLGCDYDDAGFRMPGSFANNVYIHEVIVYPKTLSSSECEKVEGYLMHKWSIKDKLPSAHPYDKNIAPK